MKKGQLDKFNSADWGRMTPELLRYCERVVGSKVWRSGESLPKGMEPPDILSIAIEKTLNAILEDPDPNKDRRNWNETVNPDLTDHLKDAVDSEVWNLLQLKEHALTNYSGDVSSEEAVTIFEMQVDGVARAETEVEDKKYEVRLRDELFETFVGKLSGVIKNDPDALKLLEAYRKLAKTDEAVKPQDAADLMGVDIDEVRNTIRRLRRAANSVKIQLKAEVTCE